jgi:hypothetical protein
MHGANMDSSAALAGLVLNELTRTGIDSRRKSKVEGKEVFAESVQSTSTRAASNESGTPSPSDGSEDEPASYTNQEQVQPGVFSTQNADWAYMGEYYQSPAQFEYMPQFPTFPYVAPVDHSMLAMPCGPYPPRMNKNAWPTQISRGSKNHKTGQCRPCFAYNSPEGCHIGKKCNFCHFPHDAFKFAELSVYTARNAAQREMQKAAKYKVKKQEKTQCDSNNKRESLEPMPMYVPLPEPSVPGLMKPPGDFS